MVRRMSKRRDRKVFHKTANRTHRMNLNNPVRGQSKI